LIDMDALMRLGATMEELDRLPPYSMGREGNPGVFRAFMNCFHPFTENLIAALGEDKLRQISSYEFKDILRDCNDQMAQHSRQLHIRNEQSVPQQSIKQGHLRRVSPRETAG
jgi:hypothetical protein